MKIKPKNINILIACEESQAECLAFRKLGFNAYSCDLQTCTFWFGVKYSKKTLYWLRNLPPILPSLINPHLRTLL